MTKDEALKMALDFIENSEGGTADLEAHIKEALAQQEQDPAEYQMRMRPTWEVSSWSDWKKCSRDAAEDYTKTPKLHDWEYEVRKLYTTPSQRTWVGLTDDEIVLISADCAATHQHMDIQFAKAIEAKLRSKNT